MKTWFGACMAYDMYKNVYTNYDCAIVASKPVDYLQNRINDRELVHTYHA